MLLLTTTPAVAQRPQSGFWPPTTNNVIGPGIVLSAFSLAWARSVCCPCLLSGIWDVRLGDDL